MSRAREEEIRLSQSSFPVSQIGFCWLGRDFDDRFRSPGERPTGLSCLRSRLVVSLGRNVILTLAFVTLRIDP